MKKFILPILVFSMVLPTTTSYALEFTFDDMLNDLKGGREVEFEYKEENYSIVNSNGKWFYCIDNQSTELCGFEEKRLLADKVKMLFVQNETMENIINKRLYVRGTLYIL